MRPAFLSVSLLASLVALSSSLELPWLDQSRDWFRSVLTNEAGRFDAPAAARGLAAQLEATRHSANQATFEEDGELRAWLTEKSAAGTGSDANQLTEAIQNQFPRYTRIAVCVLQSRSVEDLLRKTGGWEGAAEPAFTHQAIAVRAKPLGLGFQCLIVVGQRLPDFDPEKLSRANDRFFIVCPLCKRGQACEVPQRNRSVSLECPRCQRPYAMLAVDTLGHYHHVSRFLTGYTPPAHFPRGISRLDEMLLIWNAVVHSVRYVPDSADGNEDNDAWQTPLETLALGTGDCEDSALLLADWLIGRGFEARVAVGHYAERGGHAWVVARLDGKTYLFESTTPEVNTRRPPLVENVGARYVPSATIDREGFYARRDPSSPWDGDYWSPENWQRVTTAEKKAVAGNRTTGRTPIR